MVYRTKSPRNCGKPMQTYVNLEERKAITERAARYNLSVSAFIRAACLGLDLGPSLSELDLVRLRREEGTLH